MAKKHEESARESRERAEALRIKKHAEEEAASQAKRRAARAEAEAVQQEIRKEKEKAAATARKNKEELKKQQELANTKHKTIIIAREEELAAKREARIREGQRAAQERKERQKVLKARRFIRQNKINFLSSLVTPPAPEGKNKFYVTKDKGRWFTKPERFYIVQ